MKRNDPAHPMSPVPPAFAAQVKRALKERRLRQTDLVKMLAGMGIKATKAGISKLLAGRYQMSAHVQPIANLLGLRIDESEPELPLHDQVITRLNRLREEAPSQYAEIAEVVRLLETSLGSNELAAEKLRALAERVGGGHRTQK